jgi:NADH-quinone oxidoreductase subunit C
VAEQSRIDQIAQAVRDRVAADAVLAATCDHGQACLEVTPEQLVPVLEFLRRDAAHAFDFLCSVHGCDYLPQEPRLGVHYELMNMRRVERLRVKTRVTTDAPRLRTVVPLFPTADFQEREVHDMFGVEFEGHPDLRRILMPEDYEGFPQRRDFPLGGEPVIFTHNEPKGPGWYE